MDEKRAMDVIFPGYFIKVYSNGFHNALMPKLGHCTLSGGTGENWLDLRFVLKGLWSVQRWVISRILQNISWDRSFLSNIATSSDAEERIKFAVESVLCVRKFGRKGLHGTS